MTPTRLPDESPALRVVPMPADSNAYGDVFGGWIMSQVDIAGSVPAHRRARGRVATVAVTNFVFKQPVSVGDLVSFYARVLRTGRSSITVDVEVYAERRVAGRDTAVKVTEAELVYVAIDANGQPTTLPPESPN
jgi:acyl-CoA thioesterase YciA